MNRKIAAVLLAATMMATPAFAAGVANSPNTPTAPSHKITKMSEKGVKKHQDHARASYGHKVHHAKLHAKPNQVKHAAKISKKSVTSTSPKSNTKTAAAVHVKAPVKN
jgi:Ni/Co efflux regulator RcnB